MLVGFVCSCTTLEKLPKAHPDRKTFINSVGMRFIYILPGTFTMGSPANERGANDDEKQHQVTISTPFYLQATEVTQGQWKKVMGDNPSYFKSCGEDCPVESVSWNNVHEFIKRLNLIERSDNYRLPTEAEWEYACRAGTTTRFYTGNCLSTDEANYQGNFPFFGCPYGKYKLKTVKIGGFPPNPWGLYDMHGNVWEWCQDFKGEYPSGNVKDPKGLLLGSSRVVRGGSWGRGALACRAAKRNSSPPMGHSNRIGFRLVKTP